MTPFYITSSIAYVNGTPHLGFTLEVLMIDALSRYRRMKEQEVFFLTGTDEHGIKIYKTAASQGISARELCDKNSDAFKKLMQVLNVSNNDFIRTSDQKKHWGGVQKLWKKLKDSGDIYKKEYQGLYCEGCETFMPEKDLVDGNCPIHKKPPTPIAEENYFFKLSKYSDAILKKIESKEIRIVPEFRQNEIMAVLKDGGLKDVSFSRPSHILPWGIPVPSDASQNMYVWCDALSNYITALDYENEGELFQKFWVNGHKTHTIGKDIVRFHAGIWIGMLLSANLPLPNTIWIHGFLTSEGQKMSKSLGNVVDPFTEVEQYGTDALRYFLLSQVPVGQDFDFTRSGFENIYNAHLANNLGNLVNRVLTLCAKYEVTPSDRKKQESAYTVLFKEKTLQTWKEIDVSMNDYMLHKAAEAIFSYLDFCNKQMDELKPWTLAKTEPERVPGVLALFLESIRHISYMVLPFIPESTEKIQAMLAIPKENSFQGITEWNGQDAWNTLGQSSILFPRRDTK